MSFTSEDDSPKRSRVLVFLLAIAGRLDAQARIAADKLDKNHVIYEAYSILDAAGLGLSMLRYVFAEFISNNEDPEVLKQIMSSPEGIVSICLEMGFLISFSFLASYFEREVKGKEKGKEKEKEKEKEKIFIIKYCIVEFWPYFRDLLKGFKNGYRDCKTIAQIVSVFTKTDLRYLAAPAGLALGFVMALNRCWLLSMRNERKKMAAINEKILDGFRGLNTLNRESHKNELKCISYQSNQKRIQSYFSVGVGGVFDGIYLYAGLPTLAVLSFPAFIALVALSTFYMVACLISRLYDEYDDQLRLTVTQNWCRLTLVSKELEATYIDLLVLQRKEKKNESDWARITMARNATIKLIECFEKLSKRLRNQLNISYLSMVLLGVRNGLFSYGVLASFLFSVAMVFSLTPALFPPVALIACVCSGLLFMAGMAVYYCWDHYKKMGKKQNEENEKKESLANLIEMKDKIQKEINPVRVIQEGHELKKFLKISTEFNIPSKNNFQEESEILRVTGSAMGKGYNFVMFANIPFKDDNLQDHTHDSSIAFILAVASTILFIIVFFLRALARGFKAEKPKQASIPAPTEVIQAKSEEKQNRPKVPSDPLSKTPPLWSRISFFFKFPPAFPESTSHASKAPDLA
jgi:hypothetical protein